MLQEVPLRPEWLRRPTSLQVVPRAIYFKKRQQEGEEDKPPQTS
jgi:hypothetical protein